MRELWSALASTVGTMLLGATVKDIGTDQAAGPEARMAWQAGLLKVD